MSELPPIIERLDAELMDVEREFDGGADEQIAPVWMRYGPDLRAELLRLQEERDTWKQRYERVARILADIEGDEPLILQCDWGGCDKSMADIRYCPEHGDWLPVCENHTLQADALLEALKGIETEANTSLEEDEPKYMRGALRSIAGQAWAALNPDKSEPVANVEGKDE